MRRIKNRLFVRTAALFALLLIASQIIWITVGNIVFLKPLRVEYIGQLAAYVRLARSALASMPPEARPDFLQQVNHQSNIRLLSVDYGESLAPVAEFPKPMVARLRRMAGDDVTARLGDMESDAWVRFVAGGQPYWLVVSAGRPPFPGPLIIWVLIAIVVSSCGAYLLISRLNRQLRAVVEASRAIGRGEIPAAIAVEGPDEIQELSRGFNQMSEGLQRLDAERRLMLGGISHDLRTPLVRLRLNIELGRPNLNGTAAESMVRDVQEIDSILTQFLQFARNESDESAQLTDVNDIVSDVCAGYQLSGQAIKVNLGLIGLAKLRPVGVRRLITNLVDNALRYGEKDVVVTTSRNEDHIVITVADRGPGIRSSTPDELIKPFAREDVSRTKPGTGLGLTMVDKIARAHGGFVKLTNRPEGGLLALVTLVPQ